MKTKGIKLRWLYETCYEIVLPNGTVILTDPDLTLHGLEVAAKDIERVDYILVTHTHYDHTSDIGYLVEKFGCKLLVGELSAQDLCRCFNLPYSCIYPVGADETFEFPDVTFHCFRGKHTAPPPDPKRGRPESAYVTTVNRFGFEGHGNSDQYGWLEFFDYVIMAPNNQTIMICGGIPAFAKAQEVAKRYRPDVLIRQLGGLPDPVSYAEWVDKTGARIVFPSHHENIERKFGKPAAEVAVDVNKALQGMGSLSVFVDPKQFAWYEICTQIDLL